MQTIPSHHSGPTVGSANNDSMDMDESLGHPNRPIRLNEALVPTLLANEHDNVATFDTPSTIQMPAADVDL